MTSELIPVTDETALLMLEGTTPFERDQLLLLLAEGLTFSLERALIVAGIVEDPIAGTRDAYLPYVDHGLMRDAERVTRLAAAIAARWPNVDRVLIRVPHSDDVAADAPLSRYMHYLSAAPAELAVNETPPRVEVRPPRVAEIPFVHDLLVQALVDAYADAGCADCEPRARAYVTERFESLDARSGTASLVALVDGALAGQATWLDAHEDELTSATFHELVDVFVLEQYRRSHITDALLFEIGRRLTNEPGRLLGHVVAEPSKSDRQITRALLTRGWRLEYEIWRLANAEPGP